MKCCSYDSITTHSWLLQDLIWPKIWPSWFTGSLKPQVSQSKSWVHWWNLCAHKKRGTVHLPVHLFCCLRVYIYMYRVSPWHDNELAWWINWLTTLSHDLDLVLRSQIYIRNINSNWVFSILVLCGLSVVATCIKMTGLKIILFAIVLFGTWMWVVQV